MNNIVDLIPGKLYKLNKLSAHCGQIVMILSIISTVHVQIYKINYTINGTWLQHYRSEKELKYMATMLEEVSNDK